MEMDVITKEEKLRERYNIPEQYQVDPEKEIVELPIGYYYQLEQTRRWYLEDKEDEDDRKVFADMALNIYSNFVFFIKILAGIFTVSFIASIGQSKTTTLIIGGISILAWAMVILSPNNKILYKMLKLMGKKKHQ